MARPKNPDAGEYYGIRLRPSIRRMLKDIATELDTPERTWAQHELSKCVERAHKRLGGSAASTQRSLKRK